MASDEDRAKAMDAAERVCDVCDTDVDVARWYDPFWVIRCRPHDPRKYGGGE